MKRQANRFQRGSGCYTCKSCSKLTRSTGRGDNENCGLCEQCFDLASIDNSRMDEGAEYVNEQYGDEVRNTFKHRPELVALFPELAEATQTVADREATCTQ